MPIIKDDDYDVDFYTAEPLAEDANRANQGPREHLEVRYSTDHATLHSDNRPSCRFWYEHSHSQESHADQLIAIRAITELRTPLPV